MNTNKKEFNQSQNTFKNEDDYGFYSYLLKEEFRSLNDLKLAEKAYHDEQELKKAKVDEKKQAALKVEATIKERLETEKKVYKDKETAYREYLDKCDALNKLLATKRQAETTAIKEFCNKYGSFHSSITVDDDTYEADYDIDDNISLVSAFDKFFKTFW